MTPARRAHLIKAIKTLASLDEFHGFRTQLQAQVEAADSDVFAAMEAKLVVLAKREAVR